MIFIGGTNHGRSDGGIPSPNASFHRVPTLDLRGARNFHTEVYHRSEGYWRHESLTDDEFSAAVAEYEASTPRRRR